MRATAIFALVTWLGQLHSVSAQESTARTVWSEWPPINFPSALLASTAFGLLGIVLAIFGFKLFDWVTPGNLQKEVFENKNVAAAVLGAAMIFGICLILAAAVH